MAVKLDQTLKFLRRFALDGGCKCLPRRLGIIIAAICRRSWLLPPRLVQRPGIDRVETRVVHDIHDDLLGPGIIARDGAGESPWRSFRASEFGERVGQDVVEGLDHRAAELLGNPDALRHLRINVRNLWVAHTWIVVAGIDDRDILRDRIKQVLRELGYRWERDRYDNDVGALDSSAGVNGGRAFIGESPDPFQASGIRDADIVSGRRSTCGKGAADVAGSDDSDLHCASPLLCVFRIMCIIQSIADMRYEPEHKTRTRERIVRNAARKLRTEGLSGPGVASVMKASGLTVGGFYKHFGSKDELLADAIAQGFSELSEKVHSSLQDVPPQDRWKEVVRWYLSPEHCNHPGTGCPIVTLAPEIARAKSTIKKRTASLMKELADTWAVFMPGGTAKERERNFFVIFSAMAGAVAIARLLPEPADRERVLASVRDYLLASL